MARFFSLYGGDILVGALVLAGVVSGIRGMLRDKKAGKSVCGGCSGDCSHCSMHHSK